MPNEPKKKSSCKTHFLFPVFIPLQPTMMEFTHYQFILAIWTSVQYISPHRGRNCSIWQGPSSAADWGRGRCGSGKIWPCQSRSSQTMHSGVGYIPAYNEIPALSGHGAAMCVACVDTRLLPNCKYIFRFSSICGQSVSRHAALPYEHL